MEALAAVTLPAGRVALGCHPAPTVPGGNEVGTTGVRGRAVEEREARSEKVILADPIRASHLLVLLRVREDLTQAEPSLKYHMNTGWFMLEQTMFS